MTIDINTVVVSILHSGATRAVTTNASSSSSSNSSRRRRCVNALHFKEEAKDVPSLAGAAALSTAWRAKCLLVEFGDTLSRVVAVVVVVVVVVSSVRRRRR